MLPQVVLQKELLEGSLPRFFLIAWWLTCVYLGTLKNYCENSLQYYSVSVFRIKCHEKARIL